MTEDLVERLRKRAEIRRQIPGRRSVATGEPDRIADILEEAANEIDKLRNRKVIFVVEFLRYNNRENHSYVGGIFDDEMEALKEAWAHMQLRAGKYGAEVTGYELNHCNVVYSRTLDCWDAFADSCKETAEKLKAMLLADGLESPEYLNVVRKLVEHDEEETKG